MLCNKKESLVSLGSRRAHPCGAHRRVPCHRSIGSAVAWAPDGAHLACVSKDGEVVLWVRAAVAGP